jgi:hypothetical protein
LYDEGKLITWAGVLLSQGQMDGWMPVPWASWEYGAWKLTITAAATGDGFGVRYRLENGSGEAKRIRLLLAIRPFQATPPWQAFRGYGGIGKVRTVTEEDVAAGFVPPPQPFGVGSESAGLLTEILAQGRIPNASAIEDPAELGCAVAGWDFALAAGESTEVRYGLPVEEAEGLWRAEPVAQAWRIEGGTGEAVELGLALRAATAHILVNREGPALHPGPRRYDRCWIRDSAGMARALLQSGCREPVRALLEWYAPYIREDGWVPCLVDRQGPDWLPEYDSQGQFAHIVAEYLRYGGERPVAERMWPVVLRTMDCLASLRERRMTPAYREGNPPHRYGLLPESASHEGYLAHPVHSYWDDFWALRGLRDAVWLAGELGDWERRASLAALHEHFASAVAVSLEGLIAERGLDFVPGSVEWADYDPSATANGLVLLEQLPGVREELLAKTFRRYLERFRARIAESVPWDNYSAYEIRIAGALILLGWRDEALEVLGFFLKDRRPAAWNQWPEISWHNMRAAGHLGDVPHTWISAEFISAARALLVAERHLDDRLILGAGIPLSWWSGPEGLTVRDWPAECGLVTFSLKLEAPGWARWRVEGDLRIPSGGVVLAAELPGRLKSCRVDDVAVSCDGLSLPVILHAPADVQFQFDTV